MTAPSPVYGERDVTVRYRSLDLLWRPLGQLARFVLLWRLSRARLDFFEFRTLVTLSSDSRSSDSKSSS